MVSIIMIIIGLYGMSKGLAMGTLSVLFGGILLLSVGGWWLRRWLGMDD